MNLLGACVTDLNSAYSVITVLKQISPKTTELWVTYGAFMRIITQMQGNWPTGSGMTHWGITHPLFQGITIKTSPIRD